MDTSVIPVLLPVLLSLGLLPRLPMPLLHSDEATLVARPLPSFLSHPLASSASALCGQHLRVWEDGEAEESCGS